MAYEPTSWKAGDIVTSAKLNNMEHGIAGAGPLIIGFSVFDLNEKTLDHTWQEIHDAMASGRLVMTFHVIFDVDGESAIRVDIYPVNESYIESDEDYVCVINSVDYVTDSPDGYPHLGSGIPTPVG